MENKDYKVTIGDLRPLSLIENIESELGNYGLFTRSDRELCPIRQLIDNHIHIRSNIDKYYNLN